jgi:uncharacterized protein (AIM24 family)
MDSPAPPMRIPTVAILNAGTALAAFHIDLQEDEQMLLAPDAVAYADSGIELETKMFKGGFWKSMSRLAAGSSTTQNIVRCKQCPSWVVVNKPGTHGDCFVVRLPPKGRLMGMRAGFVGSTTNVEIEMNYRPAGGWMMGFRPVQAPIYYKNTSDQDEALVLIKAVGAVKPIDVAEGKTLLVDEGALLTAEQDPGVQRLGKGASGLLAGGEGYVFAFKGPQRVHVQTIEYTASTSGRLSGRARSLTSTLFGGNK